MRRLTLPLVLVALGFGLGSRPALAQPGTLLPYQRPYDQTGLNVFEPTKADSVGDRFKWGAAFTQQFQTLRHENTATEVLVNGVNRNKLIEIGSGFDLAMANLMLDAELTPGVRVNLTAYLSTRHHNETWVKGGYVQVDEARFLGSPLVDRLMERLTVKVGHFEINYGDAHFRRSDAGQAIHNPFAENYIMDAFATEIGTEVYAHAGPVLAMVGVTGGEIQGGITSPKDRHPSYLGKLAFDQQLTPDVRARLAGSVYTTGSSIRNTLYGGDRAGSHYWFVMENTAATTSANFTSGRFNPGLTDQITALQLNPFVKFRGLELFGVLERAEGRGPTEDVRRAWTQVGVDGVFRFLPREQLFVGARYNRVNGPLAGAVVNGRIPEEGPKVSIDRYEVGAGWFPVPNLLLKGSYVNQQYHDFVPTDIRNGGKFNGFVVEGVLAF